MGREGVEPSRDASQRVLSHHDLNLELPQSIVDTAHVSYYRQYAFSLFWLSIPSSLLELEEPPFHREVLRTPSPHSSRTDTHQGISAAWCLFQS
jgi:hypothetical protein